MTPDLTLDPIDTFQNQGENLSTAGMTTKVFKGSLWTLGGAVLPLLVSFISTPFIIRFLGSESYGVLLLVGLIPTYFSFADFGMGIASTKFESEAFAEGKREKEGEIVRAAAVIAFISASAVAIPLFLFSFPIIAALNVPENLQSQASTALRLTSVAFVFGILSSVLNSPMLARLRMDLNTATNTIPKILLAVGTPFILYFGGGIVGAVSWVFIVTIGILVSVTFFSGRLLPELFHSKIDRSLFRPLIRFGGGWLIAMIAAILLVNLEKLFLTRMVSVRALAYYSVAFTFANMATMFSQSIIQSLIPAFSQLTSPERRDEFQALFARTVRVNLILLLPGVTVLFVVAKPFFTLWAGAEFGIESTLPFYILLAGIVVNILANIPHCSILASGRTAIFAKLYFAELIVYAVLAGVLINEFGIAGAAAAWSIRVFLDAIIVTALGRKIAGVSFRFLEYFWTLVFATLFLAPPILFAVFYDNFSLWLIILAPISLAAYGLLVWFRMVEAEEKSWIKAKAGYLLKLPTWQRKR